jgi:hypothetical protein
MNLNKIRFDAALKIKSYFNGHKYYITVKEIYDSFEKKLIPSSNETVNEFLESNIKNYTEMLQMGREQELKDECKSIFDQLKIHIGSDYPFAYGTKDMSAQLIIHHTCLDFVLIEQLTAIQSNPKIELSDTFLAVDKFCFYPHMLSSIPPNERNFYDMKFKEEISLVVKNAGLIFKTVHIKKVSERMSKIKYLTPSVKDIEILSSYYSPGDPVQKESTSYPVTVGDKQQIRHNLGFKEAIDGVFNEAGKLSNEQIINEFLDEMRTYLIERSLNYDDMPNVNWINRTWEEAYEKEFPKEEASLKGNIIIDGRDNMFNDLRNYFTLEKHDELGKILTGGKSDKLIWEKPKGWLVTYFYDCRSKGYIAKTTNTALANWIHNNFSLTSDKQKSFTPQDIQRILEDENRQTVKANRIIVS